MVPLEVRTGYTSLFCRADESAAQGRVKGTDIEPEACDTELFTPQHADYGQAKLPGMAAGHVSMLLAGVVGS